MSLLPYMSLPILFPIYTSTYGYISSVVIDVDV